MSGDYQMKKTAFVIATGFLLAGFLYSREIINPTPTPTPPVLDGKLDEPAWEGVQAISNFKTFEPDYGKELGEETHVYCTYDRDNLYFAFRAQDSNPDKMVASLSKWDGMFGDDAVAVLLDPLNDKQSAILLAVNPLGIQGDIILSASGGDDASQDFIWDAAGVRDPGGYTVEIAIPLKSLRFNMGETVEMGFGAFRQIPHTSKKAVYPEFFPGKGSLTEQLAVIRYSGLRYQRTYELLPYLTGSQQKEQVDGAFKQTLSETNVGLTAKIGITPTLTLDATINPDFSQVEADAGQVDVNLRYDIFYPEKRPFFMEGQETFRFAGLYETSSVATVVHTRNIVNPVYGLKLSGKLGIHNSISVLSAADRLEEDKTTAYFDIARYKRLLSGDSFVGGVLTRRDTQTGHNRVIGVDSRYKLNGTTWVEGNYLQSYNQDEGQHSSGHAANAMFRWETEKDNLVLAATDITEDFDLATGWAQRKNYSNLGWSFAHSFYLQSPILQKIQPIFWGYYTRDHFYHLDESVDLFLVRFYLPRFTVLRLDLANATEVFEGRSFNISWKKIEISSQPSPSVSVYFQYQTGYRTNYDPDDLFQGRRRTLVTAVDYLPSQKIKLTLSAVQSVFTRRSNDELIYDYRLYRNELTYQVSKYLFFREITEYNAYREQLTTDFLVSFTYIPGTVIYLGYGSLYDRVRYDAMELDYVSTDKYLEMKRGLFLKASYNWRI